MNDLTGQRFGRLVVDRIYDRAKSGLRWECTCDCGNKKVISAINLRNGDAKSCGCLHSEVVSKMMSTHGESKTRLYRVWAGIKNRCNNKKASNYQYYGALGIKMCKEWEDSFEAFRDWAIENGYDANANPQECTLDRINNKDGYGPQNCRWANHKLQCNNQKSNKLLSIGDETHTMSEWADLYGINYSTLRARIRRGLSIEEAILH